MKWKVMNMKWQVMLFDGSDDEPEIVSGSDVESVVSAYADQNFAEWDYPNEIEIHIRKEGETEWRKFNVTAEAERVFYMTEIPLRKK